MDETLTVNPLTASEKVNASSSHAYFSSKSASTGQETGVGTDAVVDRARRVLESDYNRAEFARIHENSERVNKRLKDIEEKLNKEANQVRGYLRESASQLNAAKFSTGERRATYLFGSKSNARQAWKKLEDKESRIAQAILLLIYSLSNNELYCLTDNQIEILEELSNFIAERESTKENVKAFRNIILDSGLSLSGNNLK